MTESDKLSRIAEACAHAFNTTYADLIGGSKHKEPMRARVVAIWVAFKLLPDMQRRRIAKELGRRDGGAVLESVRRVLDWRASHPQIREKVDGLYRALEAELGVSKSEPKKVPQKADAALPMASTHEISWGFSGLNTGHRHYFERQNERFAEAMARAGVPMTLTAPPQD